MRISTINLSIATNWKTHTYISWRGRKICNRCPNIGRRIILTSRIHRNPGPWGIQPHQHVAKIIDCKRSRIASVWSWNICQLCPGIYGRIIHKSVVYVSWATSSSNNIKFIIYNKRSTRICLSIGKRCFLSPGIVGGIILIKIGPRQNSQSDIGLTIDSFRDPAAGLSSRVVGQLSPVVCDGVIFPQGRKNRGSIGSHANIKIIVNCKRSGPGNSGDGWIG